MVTLGDYFLCLQIYNNAFDETERMFQVASLSIKFNLKFINLSSLKTYKLYKKLQMYENSLILVNKLYHNINRIIVQVKSMEYLHIYLELIMQ